ncbi:MAG: hypothetical protein LBC89_04475 [Bacteroidales bacterium]|jgi:hypothetical protein|nr:hypothetical protein [Bacteroidales bacterium]
MNNLVQNYKKILEELTKNRSHIESFLQIRQPKLSNLEFVALNLTSEYMSYNTELQLFIVIKGTELDGKIERSNYNKRRRKLAAYTENIRQSLSQKFASMSNLFIFDSAPVKICEFSRAKRSNICATDKIQPDFGYKLHLVCDENAVVHSFDFTLANVCTTKY